MAARHRKMESVPENQFEFLRCAKTLKLDRCYVRESPKQMRSIAL